MAEPDYRGARGSNAGDDFHELWTLRQALSLLDPDTQIAAIAVEGLRGQDESGTPSETWDGVDCTFYFGGNDVASAERIVIDQLKYSSANPARKWTVARLTQTSNKKGDNSVIAKLARAFDALMRLRPDLAASGNLQVRLVSNQQVDPAVVKALSESAASGSRTCEKHRTALFAASGLSAQGFDVFSKHLDLSECGGRSRFATEERVLTTISSWTEDDARLAVAHLMRFIRRLMMPESKGEFITRESILAQLGFSDPGALFPCPSAIKKIDRLIPREESRDIANQLLAGKQHLCFHGIGGCGKTTLLQDIAARLPVGSVVITYDCYGGGRYLDSDAYRHRPQDAFLQLSNDLAQQLRSPLLLTKSTTSDYPRIFKKRLERAAEIVASESSNALLVIVADAADNSITAANTHSPPEPSFIHDFVRLGNLPGNVRCVVSCRTGRLTTLNLPPSFGAPVEVRGFSRDETAAYVHSVWNAAPEPWIDDFHYLSDGNPRVETYALDYAADGHHRSLDYLRPHGKDLDKIFEEQLEQARRKFGVHLNIQTFCAGLVTLPRPVPLDVLSTVTDLSGADISDLCLDLAPGVRLKNGLISFADEDFEHFLRTEGESQFSSINSRIADYFLRHHTSSAYAATHIASALLSAGRGLEIVNLINSEREPGAIGDPVLRRQVHLERLKIAMKICRDIGTNADAMLTVLIGAEALKTDASIRKMLIENPDLAASFARDTTSRMILRDAEEIENHGPLLFHFMAADARQGDPISAREGYRQARAWMQRRSDHFKEERSNNPNFHPQGWSIEFADIAAETEALLRAATPQIAVDTLMSWKPRSVAFEVALTLSFKLISSGESELVERCLEEAEIGPPWDLFVLTPLAVSGRQVDLSRIESSLEKLLRRRLIRLDILQPTFREEDPVGDYLEMIVTACEVVVGCGGNVDRIVPVLEELSQREARRCDKLHTSDVSRIDISLRAHTLLERLNGCQPSIATYLLPAPEPDESLPEKQLDQVKKSHRERKEELERFIGPFVAVYDARARLLTGGFVPSAGNDLQKAVSESTHEDYRLRNEFRLFGMRTQAAMAITRLTLLPNVDPTVVYDEALSALGSSVSPFSRAETQVFKNLAAQRLLHPQLLAAIAARANAVKEARVSADEKISALLRFARLLMPISYADAEGLFNQAVAVAGEVNVEAIWEIGTFAPLAERAVDAMDVQRKRTTACAIATIGSDAAIRLEGQDNFPWPKVGAALAILDLSVALAATGRWEDSAIIGRDSLLPSILKAALGRNTLSPSQVLPVFALLDDAETELIEFLIDRIAQSATGADVNALVEEIAKNELLRFGQGRRARVTEKLNLLVGSETGLWFPRLLRATAFHNHQQTNNESSVGGNDASALIDFKAKEEEVLRTIEWTAYRFIDALEINDVVSRVLSDAKASKTFISVTEILYQAGGAVAISDRVAHLEALVKSESENIGDYEIGRAIPRWIEEWGEGPSLANWCRSRLLSIITELLPAFVGYIVYEQSNLPTLLEKSGASDNDICGALLDGIARHVDVLDARTLYALIGLVGRHCSTQDAANVIERYANRLIQRIPIGDRDIWELTDIPVTSTEGLARLFYALLGDVDVRNRWRCGHAVRCLARLDEIGTLDQLIALYDRTSDKSYRRPDAPFYWLAARLWLMIALDRIAIETPRPIDHHADWLFRIATDAQFPHVLVRSFAKSALSKLVNGNQVMLDSTRLEALNRANTSLLTRKKQPKSYGRGFDRYQYKQCEERRFHFDSMDTLPYWYSGAISAFSDLDREQFLNAAETWIVERWNVHSNPWRWNDEPRQNRLERHGTSMDHDHGSLPVLERFHTYLEWHAMWCAIGELMETHALARLGQDDYDTLERKLSRNQLTVPPLWLADLRGVKPLEARFWFPPVDAEKWMKSPSDADFLSEMMLASQSDWVVIDGHHDTKSRAFRLGVKVHTALVSPRTARSLIRALQSAKKKRDYVIPKAGEDFEIKRPPYELKGWLDEGYTESGIDERDPLRYDISYAQSTPSSETISLLRLKQREDGPTAWSTSETADESLVYEAWGESRWDDRDERMRYEVGVRSSGSHLRITKEFLKQLLSKAGLDLVAEIEIDKRNKGYYDYSQHEEKAKEEKFVKILLFRKDGTVEDTNGRAGTWTASGS